jgi:hypothetical protein
VIATIDWDALWTVVWASCLAGVGVTTAYGLAILGVTRAVDLGRSGRTAEAAVYGVIGLAGAAAVLGAIVFGILVLTD